jgi:hypothetical protein
MATWRTRPFRLFVGAAIGGISGVFGGILSGSALFGLSLLLVGTMVGALLTLFKTPDVVRSLTPESLFRGDLTALVAFPLVGVFMVAIAGGVVGLMVGGFSGPVCGGWAGGFFGAMAGVIAGRRIPLAVGTAIGMPAGVALGTLAGVLAGGTVSGVLVTTATGSGLGLVAGLMAGIAYTSSAWYLLANVWLAARRLLPIRLMTFMADAYARGVLRREGALYQFRHARLQDALRDQ